MRRADFFIEVFSFKNPFKSAGNVALREGGGTLLDFILFPQNGKTSKDSLPLSSSLNFSKRRHF